MAKPQRIYIAGPMTGLPELNFPAFHAAAAELRALGYEAVNPAEINTDPTASWDACMKADIRELVGCDAVLLLPGWHHSRGAKIEHYLACELGLQVYQLTDLPRLGTAAVAQNAADASAP